jgi:hypothetical protein
MFISCPASCSESFTHSCFWLVVHSRTRLQLGFRRGALLILDQNLYVSEVRRLAVMDLVRRAGDNVNLVVYENIQPIVWITTIPFFLLCLTSCIVRLYTRAFIQNPFGIDDWFMLVASVGLPFRLMVRLVADSSIDSLGRSTIHCLDVDYPRRWTVSTALSLINTISNYFQATSPIPASKPKTLRRSALYVATLTSAMLVYTDHRYSIFL